MYSNRMIPPSTELTFQPISTSELDSEVKKAFESGPEQGIPNLLEALGQLAPAQGYKWTAVAVEGSGALRAIGGGFWNEQTDGMHSVHLPGVHLVVTITWIKI